MDEAHKAAVNPKSCARSVVLFVSLCIVIVVALNLLLIENIPPIALTRTACIRAEVRICNYYAKNGRLPPSLTALPPDDPSYADSLTDAWDRPIQYSIEGESVTLMSLGADGRPGGSGDDFDVRNVFTATQPSWELLPRPSP